MPTCELCGENVGGVACCVNGAETQVSLAIIDVDVSRRELTPDEICARMALLQENSPVEDKSPTPEEELM